MPSPSNCEDDPSPSCNMVSLEPLSLSRTKTQAKCRLIQPQKQKSGFYAYNIIHFYLFVPLRSKTESNSLHFLNNVKLDSFHLATIS